MHDNAILYLYSRERITIFKTFFAQTTIKYILLFTIELASFDNIILFKSRK